MPYNRFDIKLSDKQNQEALQAILYQYEEAIHELIEQVQSIKSDYKSTALEIISLGLTQDEVSEIRRYFLFNKSSDLKTKKNWLINWMKENVYEMPEEYILKIIDLFEIDKDFFE